jgi:hypothetical protein
MENTIQRDVVRKQNMRHEFKEKTIQDYGGNAITKIIGF